MMTKPPMLKSPFHRGDSRRGDFHATRPLRPGRAIFAAGALCALLASSALARANFCERAEVVRDAVVAVLKTQGRLRAGETCTDVTRTDLRAVKKLDLPAARDATLPPNVFHGLSELRVLDLRGLPLDSLPAGVFQGLPKVTVLELPGRPSNNKTKLAPGVFEGLSALPILDLSFHNREQLQPGVFRGLSSLRELDLSNNYLETLPAGLFADVPRLRRLNLSANNLRNLPVNVFAELAKLERLDLRHNPFHSYGGLSAAVFHGLPEALIIRGAVRPPAP